MYSVFVSRTFKKQFDDLQKGFQERIRKALKELEVDPCKSRAKADIKMVHGTKPLKYRLRVGDYRIIYSVEGKNVKIIEVWHRGKVY